MKGEASKQKPRNARPSFPFNIFKPTSSATSIQNQSTHAKTNPFILCAEFPASATATTSTAAARRFSTHLPPRPPPPQPYQSINQPFFQFIHHKMGDPQYTPEYTTAGTSLSSTTSSSPSCVSEAEDAPPQWTKKRSLSKQLSMREVPRNIAWERRRRRQRRKNDEDLTDEDLYELKGCIELGFGFNAEEGHGLCTTIPALDLYFAVNRQFFTSPLPSPVGAQPPPLGSPAAELSPQSCSLGGDSGDSRKILGTGDDPQHLKTKLRHWAQAVACSVMQAPH